MKRLFYEKRFFFIPLGIAACLALAGLVVMLLWNALMPAIFHLGVITFWQAAGLFILCKVLFGFGKGGPKGFRNGGPAPWMKQKMEERFRNMTQEERDRFKQKWSERCGGFRGGFSRHEGGFDPNMFDEKPEETK